MEATLSHSLKLTATAVFFLASCLTGDLSFAPPFHHDNGTGDHYLYGYFFFCKNGVCLKHVMANADPPLPAKLRDLFFGLGWLQGADMVVQYVLPVAWAGVHKCIQSCREKKTKSKEKHVQNLTAQNAAVDWKLYMYVFQALFSFGAGCTLLAFSTIHNGSTVFKVSRAFIMLWNAWVACFKLNFGYVEMSDWIENWKVGNDQRERYEEEQRRAYYRELFNLPRESPPLPPQQPPQRQGEPEASGALAVGI